jgi:hypothetical protein
VRVRSKNYEGDGRRYYSSLTNHEPITLARSLITRARCGADRGTYLRMLRATPEGWAVEPAVFQGQTQAARVMWNLIATWFLLLSARLALAIGRLEMADRLLRRVRARTIKARWGPRR